MNKEEIIQELSDKGIEADSKATKKELEQLLQESADECQEDDLMSLPYPVQLKNKPWGKTIATIEAGEQFKVVSDGFEWFVVVYQDCAGFVRIAN